ncbi:DinB family protein [Promicromonospora sukumoe]|uniref:DinB family protein n=1 Tax=Promicromonospora sukumoe TaxID=88382 RepID=UPI000371F3C0|nr:DinB family protein [Promicromonospora sukumoe]
MEPHEQAEEPETTRWTTATVFPDMWTDPDDDPRENDAPVTDERSMLLEYLRYYRLTLEMKCAGLDAEQLARRSAPPSTMSLLGLLRHLASGERHLRRVMTGEDAPELYRTEDDREADWTGAIADPAVVDDAWHHWRTETEATDRYLDGVTDLSTGNTGDSDFGPEGADLQLREAVLGQIVEYARHCGHADILRERVDGRVGQ